MSKAWAKGSDTRWRRFRATVLRLDLPKSKRPRCQVDGPKCIGTATHVDHIHPLAMGGQKYDPLNVRPSCEPCNTGRRGHRPTNPPNRPVTKW